MLSLMLSLLFGAGQVVAGALLTGYGARAGRWRRVSLYLALLFGVWCVASGLAELLVSGMETARHVVGQPSVSVFTLWRARADTMLLVVTLVAVGAALAHPLVRRMTDRRAAPGDTSEP